MIMIEFVVQIQSMLLQYHVHFKSARVNSTTVYHCTTCTYISETK